MNIRYVVIGFAFLAMFCVPQEAFAKKWTIDYQASSLSFAGTQSDKPFTGHFKSYVADVDFDPQDVKKTNIHVIIDMKSAATGDVQRDQALPASDWFDSKTWAQAEFTVANVKKTGANAFEAEGSLSIKGVARTVKLPFTLTAEKDGMRAKGELTVNRHDFNVGIGDWVSDEYVGKDVKIAINLMAY